MKFIVSRFFTEHRPPLTALQHRLCATRLTHKLFYVCLMLALLGANAILHAQQQRRPRRVAPVEASASDVIQDSDEVVRIDTELVPIDVTVTDAEGRLVRDLKQADFKLFEDGVERPVSFFGVEQRAGAPRPVAIVFAVDISGSMTTEEMERVRRAVGEFSAQLADRQAYFAVLGFGMRVRVVQEFTRDLQKLDRAFAKLARDSNGMSTHAYDAVDDAVRLLERHAPRTLDRRLIKRTIVLITDGFPVGDRVAPATVIERANRADVNVYSVTLPSFTRVSPLSEKKPLPTPLDVSGLVAGTGGANFYASAERFDDLFRRLAEEVVSAYVLAFYPSKETRRIQRSIRVEAPQGFFVRQSRATFEWTPTSGN